VAKRSKLQQSVAQDQLQAQSGGFSALFNIPSIAKFLMPV
jgi:hypothetical protein